MKGIRRFFIASLVFGLSLFTALTVLHAESEIEPLSGDMLGAARIRFSEPGDGFAWLRIMPEVTDWDGHIGLAFDIENHTDINSPFQLSIHQTDASIFATNQGAEDGPDKVFFLDGATGEMVESTIYWGNIWLPANFKGTMLVPFDSFNNINPSAPNQTLDTSSIFGIFFGTDILHNSFEVITIAEIAGVTPTYDYTTLLDIRALDETQFANHLIRDGDPNSQKMILERVTHEDLGLDPEPIDLVAMSGDMLHAARLTFSEAGSGWAWNRIMPTLTNWGDTVALALDIENETSIDSPFQLSIHQTDASIFATNQGAEDGPDKVYFIDDATGDIVESTIYWGNIWLPANFKGTMIVPFDSFNNINPEAPNQTLDVSNIFGIFLGVNIEFNSFIRMRIAEFAVLDALNQYTSILDVRALEEMSSHIIPDGDPNSQRSIWSRVSAADLGLDEPDFTIDPTELMPLPHDVLNGAKVSFSEPGDGFAWTRIMPQVTDWKDSVALAFDITNATAIDSPMQWSIHQTDASIFATNQDSMEGPDKTYFVHEDGTVTEVPVYWGNVWLPAGFSGTMIIPFDSFNNINPAAENQQINLEEIFAIFLGVNIQFNSFEVLHFGQIAVMDETYNYTTVLDTVNLDETAFAERFILDADANSQKTLLERVSFEDVRVPGPALRIGDVKALETFDYPTNEALTQAITTWEGGSPLYISLYEEGPYERAMRVDIGASEPGKNIFGSINIFPQPHVTDWTVWNDGPEDEEAKGMTFWVKNLSSREITINLEFDMFLPDNFGPEGEDWRYQRRNIAYGGMIMLRHENGQEFIVHAKPTFAIPVGFEGWVRIPFSQYWTPEWCTWCTAELDMSQIFNGIFLTSNTAVNEGLSFVIDNVGVYYYHTAISSLFNQPTNSFTHNMFKEED